MKRKVQKKIQLHKETLRDLANSQLADVAGASSICYPCPTDRTIPCSVCIHC